MGTTSTFLKSRVSKPTVGKWSSGFSAVKKYADANKIPLIAVWSNGDACGHCTNFETTVMNATFKKWMASSGCVFWFGCSSDKTADDKFEGTGFKWARNSKLTTYPFVRVWWKAGKVDTYKSGDDWTGGGTKGASKFVTALQKLLKSFKPAEDKPTEPTTPTDGDCDGGDCNPGCDGGDCNAPTDELKEQITALRTEFETFKANFDLKLAALEKKV